MRLSTREADVASIRSYLARIWPVVRAVFGILGALAVIALGYVVASRIRRDSGKDNGGGQSIGTGLADNASARAGLKEALDILKRARGRNSP
jgi:hypothetical protein